MTDQAQKLRKLAEKTYGRGPTEVSLPSVEQVQKDINEKICAWDGCKGQRASSSDLCWVHK